MLLQAGLAFPRLGSENKLVWGQGILTCTVRLKNLGLTVATPRSGMLFD